MNGSTEQKGSMQMPAYKNKENGSWYVVTQYTDWTGERKPKCKRGFATRREALEWEQKFQQQSAGDLDMSFEAFCEIYTNDLNARLKEAHGRPRRISSKQNCSRISASGKSTRSPQKM